MKKYLTKYGGIVYPIVALGAMIALWAIFAEIVGIELIIPSVKSTFLRFFALFSEKSFYRAVGGTAFRSLISFALGAAFALIFALLSLFKPVRLFLSPIIKVMRSVPTMSLILLTVIWLKPSTSPILIAFLINFPIMYSGFYSAITGVDSDLIEMSNAYKVPVKDRIFSLYFPQILPSAFDNMQSSAGLTIKIVISAEVIAQTRNSMGIMMQTARGYLETAELLAWTIVAIILGYLVEFIVFALKKLIVRWK